MKTQLLKLKAELKVLAEQNRKSKQLSRSQASFMDKNYPLRWSDNYSRFQKDPQYLQVVKEHREAWNGMVNDPYSEYRAKHIAYCLLRGRTIEQIEPKLKDPNDPMHTRIRKAAAKIVAEVLSPPTPVVSQVAAPIEKPLEVQKETLWNKVTSFLS